MYLKKIEAQGFKSFANKAVLEFEPGIMGIVGPNGSGKSNVADAVRWVLGEQSAKQLRGGSMQDVIFSGTETRRPMGYAYVSLTLDNSDRVLPIDYEEVTVTRQVFRSGDSEYRINGNICRLRDIYELFYDSGIGKEGYSIIGQGQIDKVLSNKPEERRQMFDEAAGIVKYKKRKEMTSKKLDSERASLQRITDILGEMERQVGPLEKQSAKARTYLKLKEELKAYEVGAYYLEASELERKLKAVRENLDILSGDLKQSHQEADDLKENYDDLNEKNDTLDREIQTLQESLSEEKVRRESSEGRIALLEEQIRTSQANKGLVEDRVLEVRKRIADIAGEREGFYSRKNELSLQLDETDDAISEREDALDELDEEIRALEFELESKNRGIQDTMEERARVSGDLQGLAAKEEQIRLRLGVIRASSEELGREQQERQSELETLEQSLADMKKEIGRLSAAASSDKAELDTLEEKAEQLRRKTQESAQNAGILRSRRENLENLTERYEGYGGSVRRVMEQKSAYKGIKGVVADLITADKQYETAIETALGGRVQNVVTDTEATAKSLIEYLKKNRFGRVTFLPVASVKGEEQFPRPEALREPGAIGRASELVQAAPELKGVVRFLLGSVLVARDMNAALTIARKYNYRLHIVTLEGEYLAPGGSISGGAYKNSSNLLGRRRELEELEAAQKAAEEALRESTAALRETENRRSTLRTALEEEQQKLNRLRLQEAALSAQAESRREDAERIAHNMTDQVRESVYLEQELTDISLRSAEASDRAGVLDESRDSMNAAIAGSSGQLEELKGRRSELAAALEEKRLEFSSLEQQDGFLLENIRRLNSEEDRAKGEIDALEKGSVDEESAVAIRQKEIRELRKSVEELAGCIGSHEQEIREKQELREKQRADQQSFFDSRELLSNRISELDKESFRLQSNEQRLTEQMEKQAEYLWEEYEMTPTEAKATANPELTNLTEVHRFISQKKGEIKELGPVNVGAIEEYREVSERYEFLRDQHDDLVKAEEELVGMIDELEEGMRSQFRERFAAIQTEFAKVFSELFAGGKGALTLEEGVDVLEAGVIINAQPPGKKLVNMMQLSGGEKALTAIALLFAIQNLKPSPFCLLDEIEAALDEPNVTRFADYLAKLKDSTQFIVITHRRGTMEMTDRLYGITMQEKGVSALVSVNLKDPGQVGLIDEK